jgi:hypothetical protein
MFGWVFDVHLLNNKHTIYNPLYLFGMVWKARDLLILLLCNSQEGHG